VLIAYLAVGPAPTPVERPERVSLPVRAARRDLYANAINEALIARPGTWLSRALVYVDKPRRRRVVNGTAALLGGSSGRLRRLQTGFVRSYALSMLAGSVLVDRGAAGGAVRMNGGNVLLSCLLLLPLVGGAVAPRCGPTTRWPSRSRWASRCPARADRGRGFSYSVPDAAAGARFQLEFGIDWIPRSAPGSRSASTASRW
jgi:hypothetical protein